MSKILNVKENDMPIYDIYIENDYSMLHKILEKLETKGHRICIVSDTTISQYYMNEVLEIVKDYAVTVETFTLHPGEAHKNLTSVNELYEHLIQSKFDRKDFLIALGGGVVGDLTGFVAATYLRGISFIQMPTTLLSMVDSSIGGKTGVDYLAYKNMVGAFKQPKAVYINSSVLNTLTEEQYISGFGEVIKYGYIRDLEFYHWLKENREALLSKESEALEYMISRSCENKRYIVERDPHEKGERALLNFGHTIGHAVEKLMDFQLLHGECVAIGMVAAAYISYLRKHITEKELEEIKAVLQSFHLPICIDSQLDMKKVLETTKNDKKMDSGKIKFIVLESIGHAVIDSTITEEELLQGIQYIIRGAEKA